MGNYRIFTLTAVISLIVDQLTKIYIDSSFTLYESITVIENFFNITYVRNPGAAFGILSDSAVRIPFFISVSVVASIGILWYLRKIDAGDRWQHFALGLIFSGAVGNLIDRVRLGEVIDFLDAHWYGTHWPAFNVADSAICVGVALMFLCTWRDERKKQQTT
ncbi:signal peptidase II . Aspartic peptidase. MEROPS family A08 [Malonomonas rubra DSM 5091]|uniref:Lipoprotein signal peptidase n=1 Tax=Malonomonas rubra DSM 5091 TaxID=1122189 RepID=A0A1M6ILB1_MALRU|nr:signal peptidase II [Malonomonas rubra]SHJ35241.1 signal peptidase II . Aspartic peptidase. MEROPS family A08 [Malonomonas rubra DSM 5091]